MNVAEAKQIAGQWWPILGGECYRDVARVLADEVDRLEAQLAYTTAEYREQLEAVHALTEQVAEMQVQMAGFERLQAVLDACLPALREQMEPMRARSVLP